MPHIRIATEDAIELAELLHFVNDWLTTDHARASLTRFSGNSAVDPTQELRDDLDRFLFLLGGNDGEHLLEAKD